MYKLDFDPTKKYLITGAAGFIGFHLSKALLKGNSSIIGIDNLNNYYDVNLKKSRLNILENSDNFTFYKADLKDKDDIFAIFKKEQPDIVINLAAQAGVRYSLENPDAYVESNIVGFVNILEACRKFNVNHLLYASSSSVYGSNKKMPFSVKDRTDSPISLYAATKKSNELIAHAYSHLFNISTTGLRFFTVYGEYGRPDMAAFIFLDAIYNNKPINVFNNGNMKRDFTYIDDIVKGVLKLTYLSKALQPEKDEPPFKVYNIGNNAPEKLTDFITYLEEFAGKKAVKNMMPMQSGDVAETYADIDDLVKDTNFKPATPLNVGLKNLVDWYRHYYKLNF